MSWVINPKTGDYVMTNGSPTDDDSLIYPAYYRVKIDRTRWMYAPETSYGSDFWTVKKRFGPNDVNSGVNIAERALQPMIDDGRASDIAIDFLTPRGRNDIELQVNITDAKGEQQTLNLPVVGGF